MKHLGKGEAEGTGLGRGGGACVGGHRGYGFYWLPRAGEPVTVVMGLSPEGDETLTGGRWRGDIRALEKG